MQDAKEPVLQVAPFVVGAADAGHVIVRLANAPSYVALSRAELKVAQELVEHPVPISEFLGRYLGGRQEIGLKAAIRLLLTLYQQNFLSAVSDDMATRLRELSGSGRRPGASRRVVELVTLILDLPLIQFGSISFHPLFLTLGGWLLKPLAVVMVGISTVSLGATALLNGLPDFAGTVANFATPEIFFAKIAFVLAVAASWTVFWQMATLAGAGAKFTLGSLCLTGGFVLRLAIDDRDAFMLPKPVMVRYHLLGLMLPWLWALVAWNLELQLPGGSSAGVLAGAFVLIGLLRLCPLYQSPVIKLVEGLMANLNVLSLANAYLSSGLFAWMRPGAKGKSPEKTALTGELRDHRVQLWLSLLACLSLFWLYGASLLFYDAFVSSVPELWTKATSSRHWLRAAAAALMLFVMFAALLLPAMRLLLIPVQNFAATVAPPLRRARRSIGSFYDRSMSPSAAVTQFLGENPILADLDVEQLTALTQVLKFCRFRARQRIITQGDVGDAFYILAEGTAQVVVNIPGRGAEVVDLLSSGDSFGEIALIENGLRTATVVAQTDAKVLMLSRTAFDQLFPIGSEGRSRLTTTIRQVKLVLEAQALSHLAPRQVREFLRLAVPVVFPAESFIVLEHEVGDAAYLIEAGTVEVLHEGSAEAIATLGRGEIIGAIALIKGTERTASVRTLTEVRCLKIYKSTFMRMCLSNVLVALVVSDLSERQLAQQRLGSIQNAS